MSGRRNKKKTIKFENYTAMEKAKCLECMLNAIRSCSTHMMIYDECVTMETDAPEVYNLSPVFYDFTMDAHQTHALLTISKLYDESSESVSLIDLMNGFKHSRASLDDGLKYIRDYDSNNAKARDYLALAIAADSTNDIKLGIDLVDAGQASLKFHLSYVDSLDWLIFKHKSYSKLIRKTTVWRNAVFAHYSQDAVVLTDEEINKKYGLTTDEIKLLVELATDVCLFLVVSNFKQSPIYSFVHGYDDIQKTISCVQQGLLASINSEKDM